MMSPIFGPMTGQTDDLVEDDGVFALTRVKSGKSTESNLASLPAEREDLDTKFIKLVADARARTEVELKRRRAESVLEARAYFPPVELPAHAEPIAFGGDDKVLLAKGVDPKRDPTLVGRHMDAEIWALGNAYRAANASASVEPGAPQTAQEERALSVPARPNRLWFFILVAVFLLVASSLAYLRTHETLSRQGNKALMALVRGSP